MQPPQSRPSESSLVLSNSRQICQGTEQAVGRMAFSTLLGVSMLAAAVILFVLAAPRQGQMNPRLRSHGVEYGVTILIVVLVIVGGAVALMGFPAVMNPALQR